jgi:beta-lactam-binding protein with PASTA domain
MARAKRSLLSDILKVAFIFLTAVILLSVASFFLLRFVVKGNEVDAPNVIGKSFVEASKILNERGLPTPRIEGYKYSVALPRDYVVEQRPVPNQKMKAGRAIGVFLSRGAEVGTVPRVIGQPVSEAESILKSRGLEVGSIVKVHSDDFPQEGVIIAHTPPANVTIQRGSKVNLLVSLGVHSVQLMMPDLRGMKLQGAQELLGSSGLKLGRITRETSPVAEKADIVLEQVPQPNDRVERGALVDVVVSSPGEASEEKMPRMIVLPFKVPAKPIRSEDEDSGQDKITYDLSQRHVKIVIEHEGGRRTIVDKMFTPGRVLEYPLQIVGRGVAKIYVDDMEWPIETREL